ncbi:peptide synthetase [Microbacterium koreense]|uniref:Peptide synthetase n=1 Tax=Microbacterium koreense TaxID=323761 RepID=A0ABW2ZQ50_9MICO
MRLTNIARVTVPEGSLHILGTTVRAEPGAELPISFDQRRHVGEGDRDGSWMALAFDAPPGTTLDALADGWARVVRRHGALRTVFARDATGRVRLRAADVAVEKWVTEPVEAGSTVRETLHRVLDARCRPFAEPSHVLAAVRTPDGSTTVVIASDHSHVDMWSLLVAARDLLSEPASPPPADFAMHSAALETKPLAPTSVTDRWAAILAAGGGVLPVFPLPLGDLSSPRPEVVDVRDLLDADEVRRFEAEAQRHGVRPTSLALSAMAEVTRTVAGEPLRAVFPVHSRHEPRWHESVGWFITNSVIECTDADPAACARALKEALTLGSHPLAPILGREGAPANPGMFAISWLDTRRLPDVAPARGIRFISAQVRTDGVMVWFILNETGMHLRCRYPDTPEAREHVGGWLDAVSAALRDRARVAVEVP